DLLARSIGTKGLSKAIIRAEYRSGYLVVYSDPCAASRTTGVVAITFDVYVFRDSDLPHALAGKALESVEGRQIDGATLSDVHSYRVKGFGSAARGTRFREVAEDRSLFANQVAFVQGNLLGIAGTLSIDTTKPV